MKRKNVLAKAGVALLIFICMSVCVSAAVPSIYLTVNPKIVDVGGSVELVWEAENAEYVELYIKGAEGDRYSDESWTYVGRFGSIGSRSFVLDHEDHYEFKCKAYNVDGSSWKSVWSRTSNYSTPDFVTVAIMSIACALIVFYRRKMDAKR